MAKSRKQIKNQCTAKSKRTQKRCKRSAAPGKHVCYYHGGPSPGAPKGHTNSVKHGFYSDALIGAELKRYEVIRVKPNTLDDHIALLEVKIHRLTRVQTGKWSFDDWKSELHQEFNAKMPAPGSEGGDKKIPVFVKKRISKPLGPEILCTMLGRLTDMYWRRHQMLMDGQGDTEADAVKFVKSPFPMPDKKRKKHADKDLDDA